MSPRRSPALLDERFRLLTGGRRTAVERHQTLRATVDWSYSLLDERERIVFDRLGVFAGTFDAAAADRGRGRATASRRGTCSTRSRAWSRSRCSSPSETPTGTTRYPMLETLRQYARERLDEAGDTDVWRRRHARRIAAFAERAGPGLLGPDELPWRPRLHAELNNLRAAVSRAPT